MRLRILLPFRVFSDIADVARIVVETSAGSYGLLPQRLDCTATLAPGILFYQDASGGESLVAVDEGVLVKAGADVRVSVRRAIAGSDLDQLHAAVDREFRARDEHEQQVRTVLAKLEAGLLLRLGGLHHA